MRSGAVACLTGDQSGESVEDEDEDEDPESVVPLLSTLAGFEDSKLGKANYQGRNLVQGAGHVYCPSCGDMRLVDATHLQTVSGARSHRSAPESNEGWHGPGASRHGQLCPQRESHSGVRSEAKYSRIKRALAWHASP